jgi:hypothetical protein
MSSILINGVSTTENLASEVFFLDEHELKPPGESVAKLPMGAEFDEILEATLKDHPLEPGVVIHRQTLHDDALSLVQGYASMNGAQLWRSEDGTVLFHSINISAWILKCIREPSNEYTAVNPPQRTWAKDRARLYKELARSKRRILELRQNARAHKIEGVPKPTRQRRRRPVLVGPLKPEGI